MDSVVTPVSRPQAWKRALRPSGRSVPENVKRASWLFHVFLQFRPLSGTYKRRNLLEPIS